MLFKAVFFLYLQAVWATLFGKYLPCFHALWVVRCATETFAGLNIDACSMIMNLCMYIIPLVCYPEIKNISWLAKLSQFHKYPCVIVNNSFYLKKYITRKFLNIPQCVSITLQCFTFSNNVIANRNQWWCWWLILINL